MAIVPVRLRRFLLVMLIFFLGSAAGIGALTGYVWFFVPVSETGDCAEDELDDVRPRFRSFLNAMVRLDKEALH